ncbi:hypothetical protein NPX79_01135 [Spiroplasma endosymbiont of Anurida maritima]|uniref:hypothetical protein n=1 Tax=Spiroplasma endosymbiont of Anurida maritima TaxID=2967972 RepID=UPI0036D267BA
MFVSIKEKMQIIKNSTSNKTKALIASYILNCIEYGKTPKILEASEWASCSESVITTFAKKNGYDGFRELAIRVKIEIENYEFANVNINFKSIDGIDNYRKIIEESLSMIDEQKEIVNNAVAKIKDSEKVFLISSYQQIFNAELFASELQLSEIDARFNISRKSNAAWIKQITDKDMLIVIAFGLDNEYVTNYYELFKCKTDNILIITSPSQRHKFDKFSEKIIVDYSNRKTMLESSRSIIINYLLSSMVYKVKIKH